MTELAVRPSISIGSPGALAGIRVIEIGFAAAGPLVGKYLANHGAEVIKLESRRAPDVFRSTYPPFKDNVPGPDRAGMFAFYNDGKRAVTLDLKHPRGLELARALIAKSDVVIESFPTGTMAKRGLSYEILSAADPGLVMLSSCNQGQTGPHAEHPGYGSQLTCLAGFVHLLGERDGSPVILYGPYIDYIAVGYGVIAILAALARRRATGCGTYIDLSQYEAGLQFMGPALLEHRLDRTVPTRDGDRDTVAVPHGVYPSAPERAERASGFVDPRGSTSSGATSLSEAEAHAEAEPTAMKRDRWIALSVWSDDEWRRLREVLGEPAWAADAALDTADGRRAREAELDRRIGEWTRGQTRDEAVRMLRARALCAAPVLSISEVVSDPQLTHRAFFRGLTHPVIGTVQAMSAPFSLSATPSRQERAGPPLGADNDLVFGRILGLNEEERAALARDGVFD